MPNLIIQPNTHGGTTNKIMSLTYRTYVVATQERKIKQTTKSKTSRLASKALLGPSRKRKIKDCRQPTLSDTTLDSGTYIADPFSDDSTEEEENSADCVFLLVVSLNTTMEKSVYDVRNISDGRTHSVCEACHG
jgi:hypothetical protein